MDTIKNRQKLSELGLIYSAVIWGSTFFVVKDALQNVDPMILIGYRFLLAAILAGGSCIVAKKALFKNVVHGLLLGFLSWLLYASQTIGLSFTTASNSGFITGLFIVFVPIFALIVFRKAPSLMDIIATCFSLLGLWILTGGLTEINLGDILTLISAVTYALHILLVDRYIREGDNPFVLSFQQFLVTGAISLSYGVVFGLPFSVFKVETVGVILFLALLPTFSAFLIQNLAQKFVKPIRVSLILAFEPVFAALFAWTLGNELLVFHRAIGGFFIFGGLIISGIPRRYVAIQKPFRIKQT